MHQSAKSVVTHEDNQYAEYLEHEPTVTRNARIIFEQFSLRAADIGRDVDSVGVDALDRFPLLGDHLS